MHMREKQRKARLLVKKAISPNKRAGGFNEMCMASTRSALCINVCPRNNLYLAPPFLSQAVSVLAGVAESVQKH